MCRLAASSSAASGSPACAFRPSSRPASGPGLPRLQAIDFHPDFTRDRVQRLAAQQPHNHVPLAARAPPLPGRQGPQPPLGRRRLRSPGGLPPSAPTQLPSHASTEPCPLPPSTFRFSPNPCPRKLGAPQPRKAARFRCLRSWRRSSARGRVRMCPVRPAPKVVIRAAARTFETPKSCSASSLV